MEDVDREYYIGRLQELEAALYRAAGRFSVIRGQGAKEAYKEIMDVLTSSGDGK